MNCNHPLFLVIDLFGGGGGDATGFFEAEIAGQKIAKVIVCVNHDKMALKTHSLNYPEVKHFREDIRTVDLSEIKAIVDYHRKLHPDAKVIVWGSFPCPHFSKALGNKPKDEGIRTMAKSIYMNFDIHKDEHIPGNSYLQILDPDYIMIENVEEFKTWGPLNEIGRPITDKNGEYFNEWRNDICSFGYVDSWKEINSADLGELTSRNRLFGVFSKPELPIQWPIPTHAQYPDKNKMYPGLKQWRAVREQIDFSHLGQSIFKRKKRLVDNTVYGIIKGVKKFALKGDGYFLYHYYVQAFTTFIDTPCPTFRTKQSAYLIQAFIHNPSHGGNCTSIHKPCPVIVARQDKAPLRLTTCIKGTEFIAIDKDDSPAHRELKEIMNQHGITDIFYRPLSVQEKKVIQGFPADYELCGTKAEKEKQIGNSVVPGVAKAIAESMGHALINQLTKKVA